MIRLLSLLSASAFVFISASCCCTSDTLAPGLRPLPQFKEIQVTESEVEVDYSK